MGANFSPYSVSVEFFNSICALVAESFDDYEDVDSLDFSTLFVTRIVVTGLNTLGENYDLEARCIKLDENNELKAFIWRDCLRSAQTIRTYADDFVQTKDYLRTVHPQYVEDLGFSCVF